MSQVFLVRASRSDSAQDIHHRITALFAAAELSQVFAAHDISALKLHVGEPGTRTFVPPSVVKPLVACMRASGCRPFLTDSAVLYRSPRDNAVTHAQVAQEHGFTFEATGAPFVPADGLIGADEVEMPLAGGTHFDQVHLASAIVQARSMLVLSHVTGHLGTGLGATLKNLGMGCCSRKSKLRQHHGQAPHIREEACTACGTCEQWCPAEAITVDGSAHIDDRTCIGCGECIAVCRDDAVAFEWGIMGRELQERVVEHAAALVRSKPGRIAYVSSLQAITKDCDCLGLDQPGLVDDIGFLASLDPVAIDQAALDLIRERAGQSLESLSYPRHDASIQLAYAEQMGLGSRDYELKDVQ